MNKEFERCYMSEVPFKPLDCYPEFNRVFESLPYDKLMEKDLLLKKACGQGIPEIEEVRLLFFFYLYMYEKFGRITCGNTLEPKEWHFSTFELGKNSYSRYLDAGFNGRQYYDWVFGL